MDLSFVDDDLLVHHDATVCYKPCPLHGPSKHLMTDWPLTWWERKRIMARWCPHGLRHPDPDDLKVRKGYLTLHTCDGCCAGRGPRSSTILMIADPGGDTSRDIVITDETFDE